MGKWYAGVLTTQILEMTDVDSNESGWITENCSLLEGKIKVWRASNRKLTTCTTGSHTLPGECAGESVTK